MNCSPAFLVLCRFKGMDDWALSDDNRPTPAWLVYCISAAAGIALVAMILMALWFAAMFLIPMP